MYKPYIFHDYLHILYVILCCIAAVVSVVGYFQHDTECALCIYMCILQYVQYVWVDWYLHMCVQTLRTEWEPPEILYTPPRIGNCLYCV